MANVITAKVSYNGHNVKASSDVELKLKFSQEELNGAISLLDAIGYQIVAIALIEDTEGNEQKLKLGTYNFWKQSIDNDGEASVTLRSNSTDANLNSLCELAELNELVTIKFKII